MRVLTIILIMLTAGCASQQAGNPDGRVQTDLSDPDVLLRKAQDLLVKGHPEKAIDEYIMPVINSCAIKYENSKEKIYAAREQSEVLFYMLTAASESESASVVPITCANALYLGGYAYLELDDSDRAEQYLNRAVDMSPVNALYLSELGHLHHKKKDWKSALEVFELAEIAAESFSPAEEKNHELARAKRGVGYSLIELGRLDEAETKFQECLDMDPLDKSAMHEIRYIQSIR